MYIFLRLSNLLKHFNPQCEAIKHLFCRFLLTDINTDIVTTVCINPTYLRQWKCLNITILVWGIYIYILGKLIHYKLEKLQQNLPLFKIYSQSYIQYWVYYLLNTQELKIHAKNLDIPHSNLDQETQKTLRIFQQTLQNQVEYLNPVNYQGNLRHFLSTYLVFTASQQAAVNCFSCI